VSKRWILTFCLIATAPAAAAAQFTTFITPPNPTKDSINAAVAAEQKATTDSITHAQIANMKSWVDSTAGITVPPVDTAFRMTTVTDSMTTASANGVLAPSTASPLPFLLAAGMLALFGGLYLVRRPDPAARRIDRRE
jgi:hypothetical protein